MSDLPDKHWHVVRTVELGAPRRRVWEVIGGFFTIHQWHPDITLTEILADQTSVRQLRRHPHLPGAARRRTEELVSMDNDDFHYRYKWHSGAWGEQVQNYQASLRVLAGRPGQTLHRAVGVRRSTIPTTRSATSI